MHLRLFVQMWAAACFTVVAIVCCAPVDAAQKSKTFKKGDRVEVNEHFEWRPGTVIGPDSTGWINVKVDKSDSSRSLRNEAHTAFFPPDDVRPIKAAQVPQTPDRMWTDRSGKFSIKARFQEVKGNNVVLAKADGKTLEVPLEKLSDGDSSYVKGLAETSDNPFAETGATSGSSSSTDSAAPSGPTKKANWHEVKAVRPQTFAKWLFTPAGGSPSEMMRLAGASDVDIPLHDIDGSDKFFEKVDGLYVSHDGNRVIVCRQEGKVARDKQQFLELVDVAKKQAGGLVPIPEGNEILDVDADAGLVMYRPQQFASDNKALLTVARLEGDKLSTVTQWEPYAHEDWEPRRDIQSGWFLGGSRILTINLHGQSLTVWDVDACKALVNVPVNTSINLKSSLSPDRKLLAVIMKEGVAIIDLAAARHVATISTKGQEIGRVEFRSDNARLAGISSQGVTVWDLTNGQITGEFFNDVVNDQSSLTWAGEYLLAQNRFLFDVYRRIILWEYQNADGFGTTAAVRDGRMFFVPKVARNTETTLVSATLPHTGALELGKSLPSAEELLVVKPGDSVAIEVDIDPSVQLTDEVQKALTANLQETNADGAKGSKVVVLRPGGAQVDLVRQSLAAGLQASGLKVVDHADLVVKAVCKPQPQQVIRIRVDNRFPPRPEDIVERSITPHATYLEMKLGETELWKRGFVARPNVMIFMQQGETLDQALERLTRPNIRLFTNNKFSPYVAKPGTATESGAYGVSQMTTRGVIDGSSSSGQGAAFE